MNYEENDTEPLVLWSVIILLILIGGWLRVLLIGNKGLWLDETISIWLANHSVADMLQWVGKIDQHPPLYYLLLHYWIALNGDTPYYARLLSALFGAATIPVIYLIGKRMAGMMVGFVAAVLLTTSPFNIRFAQETRMYTLLTFNAAVAIYALVRLLSDSRSVRPIGSQFREYLHAWRTSRHPEPGADGNFSYAKKVSYQTGWRAWIYRHRWSPIQTIETDLAWVVFILFSAATLYSHNTALLFPLATNVFVLGLMLYQRIKKPKSLPVFQAPSFWNWMKAQIGIILLWSPWILVLIRQASRADQMVQLPKPGWDTIIQTLRVFISGFMTNQAGLVAITWILYAGVLCLGLVYFFKKMSRFLFLFSLFAIPFLGELIVSVRTPIFSDRTLIWITIPLFLVLAAGIVQLRFRFLMIVMLGILAANNLFSTGDYYRFMQKENWSNAAGYVAYYAQKDDLILFNTARAQIPFDYYFKPYEKQYSLQVKEYGVPVDMLGSGVPEKKMEESDIAGLISLLSGKKRVWLVYSHNSDTDPMGLIPQTLATEMKLIRKRDFYGGQVQLYEAP